MLGLKVLTLPLLEVFQEQLSLCRSTEFAEAAISLRQSTYATASASWTRGTSS
jgi:hypothetical protein